MPCHQSFLRQQGVPGAEQGWHQRRPLLLPVISISDARLTYLQRLCKVLLARCFPRCVCFMLNLVTFSPLEGNLVPCEPRLIILETFRLYSRLISCTRKISILHLEFKCVCVCVCVCVWERECSSSQESRCTVMLQGVVEHRQDTWQMSSSFLQLEVKFRSRCYPGRNLWQMQQTAILYFSCTPIFALV